VPGRMPKRLTSSALKDGVGANVQQLVTTASTSAARRPCARARARPLAVARLLTLPALRALLVPADLLHC
jgi:hypothetical protein